MLGRTLILLIAVVAALAAAESDVEVLDMLCSESGFEGAVTVATSGTDGDLVYWTVNVPYLDIDGAPKMGQGRLIVRRKELASGHCVPLFFHCHYEKHLGGARKWCRRGWAVATVHVGFEDGEYPLETSVGDSVNLNKAIVQWARRVPFVDRARVHMDGASQGGFMALTMAAENFPVAACTADVPVINWAFSLSYAEANKPVSGYPGTPPAESPMPILRAVSELADEKMHSIPVLGCYGVFGADLTSDAWYLVSPISFVDLITCPVLIQVATGDMLVPHSQVTSRFPRPIDPELFPKGYQRDFASLTLNEKARRTLEEIVGGDNIRFHLLPLPEGIHEFTRAAIVGQAPMPKGGPENIDRPWDPTRQWNVAIFDEGPPLPHSGHTRYSWACSPDGFVATYKQAPLPVDLLTPSKLDRVLQRYMGELANVPMLADGAPANRLNYPRLEKLDAVTGLLDYASTSRAHAKHLARVYRKGRRKPFGHRTSVGELCRVRERLLLALGA